LGGSLRGASGAPPLLAGTGRDQVHLVVLVTADRGLAGAFNSNLVRRARRVIADLLRDGKTVKLLTVGRKGRDQLRRTNRDMIVGSFENVGRRTLAFEEADAIARQLLDLYERGEFDVATMIYARFKTTISSEVTVQQLIPVPLPPATEAAPGVGAQAIYEYEPSEEAILVELLPRNLSIQIFRALLENAASEHGARMAAMDNATRNAGEMIGRLTLNYNHTRQAMITKELIEIISGAEAV
ncbi:MAG TPA: F0F1 ATP synthase subunit gamma, partial [Vicinamibacterales bacterium]|nr:F0F1 ATP synthase subunit gamma [Vicinamibacterales bacterium]